MAGKIKGITIEIGGDTQKLNKALEDVNKKTRDVQSELRQVERLLKLDPGNTELLAQKQRILADAVENSREKLNRLKTVQEQVNEQFKKGEISEEQYRAFQREVVKAEQELEKFEKQLRETGLTAEQVGKKMQDAGQKMTDIGKDLSLKVTAPIVAAGGAAFKMAADLQDALGATDQIFKGAADSVKSWADNLESYYGIAEGEALEYANMMGTLLMNIGGLTEQEAAKQAQILVQLAGDLTAMFGGETSSAIQALTGALKGNTAMLDNYGIACNDALIKTKALEMGIWDGKGQMDLAAKQAATLALIMEQTGAAQGQAAREAEGASGSMRAFTTEIKNLATDIGETLLPVITPFIQRLKDIVGAFGELSPGTQKAIIAIAGIVAAIGPLLMVLGPFISAIGGLIIGLGKMSAALAGGATLVSALSAGFPALGAAITLITGPIGLVIAGITALVAAGVLLYKNWDEIKAKATEIWTAIKDFFSETWDGIKQTATDVWNGIKDFFKKWGDELLLIATGPAGWAVLLGRKIAENWDEIKAKAAEIWGVIRDTLAGILDAIKGFIEERWNAVATITITVWATISDWLSTLWERIKAQVTASWNAIYGTIKGIWTLIKDGFDNLVKAAWDWGKNLLAQFIAGIQSKISALWDTLTNIAETVAGFLGFHSPTKLGPGRYADQWAPNFMRMFADGITKNLPLLEKALSRAVVVMQMSLAGGGSISNVTYNTGGNTINITVQDGEDLLRTLHRLGVRIP